MKRNRRSAAIALCVFATTLGCADGGRSDGRPLPAAQNYDYSGFVKVSEVGLRTLAVEQPAPEFPVESLRQNHFGVAVVTVNVEADGRVIETRVLEAPDESIASSLASTLSRWRFRPYRLPQGTQDSRLTSRLVFYFDIEAGKGVVRTAQEKAAARERSASR